MRAPLREEAQLSVVVRCWASPSRCFFALVPPFLFVSEPQQLLPGFEVEVEALICTSMLGRDKKTWHRTSRPPSGLNMSGTHTNAAKKGPKYAVSRGIDFPYFDLASAVDLALLSYMSSCMPCVSHPVQGLIHAALAALMQNNTE